ncbi:MAG TPA: hypothetical protein PK967_12745 [Candidatus Hydrogenedentes bacterium]|nr:hypothetical protein [Candidatus Hydrogenedentota bacterium]
MQPIETQVRRAHGEAVPGPDRRRTPARPFAPGNKAAVKHGAYASSFVTPEERERFLAVRHELAREIKKELGPDTIMLDMAALLVIRHGLAFGSGQHTIAAQMLTQVLNLFDRLKVTKLARETGAGGGPETSPAEWASDLLAEAAAREAARKETNSGQTPEAPTPESEAPAPTPEAPAPARRAPTMGHPIPVPAPGLPAESGERVLECQARSGENAETGSDKVAPAKSKTP